MNPLAQMPRIEIVRSFARKINMGNYESADFFASAKLDCSFENAGETSERLFGFVQGEVLKSIVAYRKEMMELAELSEHEALESLDRSSRGFRADTVKRDPVPEESPFKVTAEPKPGRIDIVHPDGRVETVQVNQDTRAANEDHAKPGSTPEATPTQRADTQAPAERGGTTNANEDPATPKSTAASKEEPAPRGRRRAAEPTTQPNPVVRGVTGKPDATVPSTPDQQGPPAANTFKATDDDMPDNLRSNMEHPKSTENKQVSMTERIKAMLLSYCSATGQTRDKIHASLGLFIRAFLDVTGDGRAKSKTWPKCDHSASNPELYQDVVPILESFLKRPGMAPKVLVDPHKWGLASGAGWDGLRKATDGWALEFRERVMLGAIANYPENPLLLITKSDDTIGTEAEVLAEFGNSITGAEQEGLPWSE